MSLVYKDLVLNYTFYCYMMYVMLSLTIVNTIGQLFDEIPLWVLIIFSIIVPFIALLFFFKLDKLVKRLQTRSLKKVSTDELHKRLKGHAFYYPKGCPPGLILLELQGRGEDVQHYVEDMVSLLGSSNRYFQRVAFEALFLFPKEWEIIMRSGFSLSKSESDRESILKNVKEKLGLVSWLDGGDEIKNLELKIKKEEKDRQS